MNEKLLQFIWQQQYFNHQNLQTEDGEDIAIIQRGTLNTNQGPDFFNATITINQVKLVGNIEIHVLASDFVKHKHQQDLNYNNLILHVVWENDLKGDFLPHIPVLLLQDKVANSLLSYYKGLMESKQKLPCSSFLPLLSDLGWLAWKESLLAKRLTLKSELVLDTFNTTNQNWEETFWQLLAYNFGLPLNAALFKQVASNLSNTLLSKHKNNVIQVEALLLGQANLLESIGDDTYAKMLQKEYNYLKKKYQLNTINTQPAFLRMRPANFPTVRLAQLAGLISKSNHLFSLIKETESISNVENLFQCDANDYWLYHYTLKDESSKKPHPKNLGQSTIHNIIINTIAPVLFAYGTYCKEEIYKEKAILFLQELPIEDNAIIKQWKSFGIEAKSAFDSQALLELYKNYCLNKQCLRCSVGNKILKLN